MNLRRKPLVAAGTAALILVLAGCKGNTAASTQPSAGAPQPGVTKTTITVGTVASLTGLIPGLFAGAPAGVKAYLAYVDSTGGVDGHQLVDSVKDDVLSCATNTQGATALAASTFALVGSFSIEDSCTEPIVKKDPTLPYVGVPLSQPLGALPNEFSPEPTPPGYELGPDRYIIKHYGVSRVGFISASGSQQQTEAYEFAAAKAAGATVAYTTFAPGTQTDFTSNVIRMRKDHVDWVDLSADSVNVAAEVIQAMHQQNFHPKVVSSITAYDSKFFGLLPKPSFADGVLVPLGYSMFLGEDSATVPAVKLFNTWLAKTSSVKPDLYALYGWTSAELFVQALKAAGANPTRAAVVAALKNIHSFNGDGILATSDPGGKGASTCWVLAQAENGKFRRIPPSTSGYTCSPGGYYKPAA